MTNTTPPLPRITFSPEDVAAIENIVRKVVAEATQGAARILEAARADLSTLLRRIENLQESVDRMPRPTGAKLLAEIFSSLAVLLDPPKKL